MRKYSLGFLFLVGLTGCSLGHDGNEANTERINHETPPSIKACGYDFPQEPDSSQLDAERTHLDGRWIGDTSTFSQIKGISSKGGFLFAVGGSGSILFQYDDLSSPPSKITDPDPAFTDAKIGALIPNFSDGTYRALELSVKGAEPSYRSCSTYLYKYDRAADRLFLTAGQISFIYGNKTKPSITEVWKGSPGFTKFKRY